MKILRMVLTAMVSVTIVYGIATVAYGLMILVEYYLPL